jgi:hypothetical protein
MISMDDVHRVWLGSIEITELVRRQFVKGLPTGQIAPTSPPAPWGALGSISSAIGAGASVSSPFGRQEARGRAFWFNVNAELIIYGATEPDAQVSLGDRVIRLRPDGSFSYRFALPDGEYALPAVAKAADGAESRSADLHFARATLYQGKVEAHPQDPALKPPRVENLE